MLCRIALLFRRVFADVKMVIGKKRSMIKGGDNQSFLVCTPHYTSTGRRGSNLNVYFTYTVTFGGHPIDKSVPWARKPN